MPTEAERQPEAFNTALDLYEVLQVSQRAEQEVIEAAYKRLALKYHPDLNNSSPEATRRMQELNQAYAVLSDPEKRAEYDLNHIAPAPNQKQAKHARYQRRRPNRTTRAKTAQAETPPETPVQKESGTSTEPETEPETAEASYSWEEADFVRDKERERDWNYVPEKPRRNKALWLISGLIGLMLLAMGLFTVYGPLLGAAPENSTLNIKEATLPANVIFADDFDAVLGANWTLDNPWHLTTLRAASGSYSLWLGDESKNTYRSGLDTSATLARPVSLGEAKTPLIRFRLSGQFGNTNSQDLLRVEVAEPGHDFETAFKTSGNFANWQDMLVDLGKWKNKTILIRFRFSSSALATPPGATGPFIDDVQIER